ncbi:hypothetical protein HYH03_015725 [Edaphochlamys debaryana]|uniref:Carbohydrate kinase PfkB domain-containing protein n=1 Tax=Edaphochlamys debaryana TaxID=47281 RepID=A0A836BQW6_9CHLO|nr:hypothetical protein HYH03_015725 [Edaphochlamys debaryana]|eukprot:KAG2485560.1 hypothetical protein HYH03_015725 [Edaphochlamys debaryana]
MECVCFTLIVDDIVLPHGETVMEVLGGGGPQTLFGYQLATGQSAAVGLSAGVGADLPKRCKDWLLSIGADTSGLVLHPRPTPRAWQVFEEWGRRTQIWRGRDDPNDQLYDMLRPKYDTMPYSFQRSSNYHLGVHPLHPPQRLLTLLRAAAHAQGGALSVEPYTAAETPATPEQVSLLLSHADIFSPNEDEAASLVGPGTPEELASRLLALSPPGGAGVVVVRCGASGVLAARRRPGRGEEEAEAYQIPSVADTRVVDVTGCGNAFCGGFLASMYRQGRRSEEPGAPAEGTVGEAPPPAWLGASSLAEAGAWGCVAASLMAEERGVPTTPIRELQPVRAAAAAPQWRKPAAAEWRAAAPTPTTPAVPLGRVRLVSAGALGSRRVGAGLRAVRWG